MAVDLVPFGSTTANNVNGTGSLAVLVPWRPSTPREIPVGDFDAVRTALERLYFLWSRDPTWRALAEYIGGTWAPIVEQQAQLSERRLLANACGQSLDDLGYGVGLPRQGLGCEAYRAAIRVRGTALSSNGLIADQLAIVAGLFGAEAAVGSYVPLYPAGFALYVPSLTAAEAQLLAFLIWDEASGIGSISAGVGVSLVVTGAESPGWDYTTSAGAWAGPRWAYSTYVDPSSNSTWGYAYTV